MQIIERPQLQAAAAASSFVSMVLEESQKRYDVRVYSLKNVWAESVNDGGYENPPTDYRVSVTLDFSFSLKDFQKHNPELRLQGLDSAPISTERPDCLSTSSPGLPGKEGQ